MIDAALSPAAPRKTAHCAITRRNLLASAAMLALSATAPAAFASPSVRRRARPGTEHWPEPSAWDGLNQETDGNLSRPQPLLGPCAQSPSTGECRSRLQALRNPYFLGDQPSGTQVSGWLDAWSPQSSAYVLAARTPEHVASAVKFAAAHDLRVAVKGGGHSYQGTSNAPDSLLIWSRKMRAITLHDGFVPSGGERRATPVPAVTVEAGAVWMDVYDAVTTRAGRYVQGGGCATVGVAGLIQSGGFGSFSKRFGLASAGLLEAEIVTAEGRIRTVNAYRDSELFWALKGGGGGTFGVVTKLTLRTHTLPDQFGSMSLAVEAGSETAFAILVERFLAFYADSLCNPHWGESVQFTSDNKLRVSLVCQGLSDAEIETLWQPFLTWLDRQPDIHTIEPASYGTRPARSWWDAVLRKSQGSSALLFDDRPDAPATHAWWAGDQEQVSAYLHGYDSVWLSARLLEPAKRAELAQAILASTRSVPVALHFNKGLSGAPAEILAAVADTAVNPQVITSFALAIVAAGGPPPIPELGRTIDLQAARDNARQVGVATAQLRALAPQAGSYLSESNFFNEGWQSDFWGSHYRKLRAVKNKYDPNDLFIVHHGVGSENWSPDGFERR